MSLYICKCSTISVPDLTNFARLFVRFFIISYIYHDIVARNVFYEDNYLCFLIFNDLSKPCSANGIVDRNFRVWCNLSMDGIVYSCVWRVTLSLDGLLSAPDILRNTLNSLCHVVFVVEAFIDLKHSSEPVAAVRVERRVKGGKCNWFDHKLLIIQMRISMWPNCFWIFYAITRWWRVMRNLWNADMNKQRSRR